MGAQNIMKIDFKKKFLQIKKYLDKHFFVFSFIILLVVGILIYLPTLQIDFLSDDWGYAYLAKNNAPQDALKYFYQTDIDGNGIGNFRPLESFLVILVWKPFLNNPYFIHLMAIIMHIIVAFLVGFLFHIIFKDKKSSLISAFLFLLFPLNMEVVCWLCSSWNTLPAIIFLLLSIIFYCRDGATKHKIIFMYFFVILSLLAKEFALLIPIITFFIDLLLKRKPHWLLIISFVILDLIYFFARFLYLGQLGGYTDLGGQSLHTQFSLIGLVSFIKLPIVYVVNFFNWLLVPGWLKYSAAILIFILILYFIILFFTKKDINKKQILKNIFILFILIYIGSALAWNLINPLSKINIHSRLYYLSNVWFVFLLGYLFLIMKNNKIFKTLYILYLICLISISYYQMQPWLIANEKTKEINFLINNVLKNNESKKKLEIINLSDAYQNAYIYRNGIDSAVALINNYKKDDITIEKKMQASVDLPIIVNIK